MKRLALLTLAAVAAAPLALHSPATAAEQTWRPMFGTLAPRNVDPRALRAHRVPGLAIPTFTSSVTSPLDGNNYSFTIVGTNPQSTPASSTVQYVPIVVKVKFRNGVILDPTKPGCNDTVSVQNRFFGSPLFNSVSLVSNGINVGTTQIEDGFQRAEFWQYVANSNYHVLLSPATSPIVVQVNAPTGSRLVAGVCSGSSHDIGEIPINAWDSIVQNLDKQYANPGELPLALSYNVFETSGGSCCILGYHSAFGVSSGTQVYSVGAYNDAGIFSVPIEDIHAWTHEIGETFNDPYVNNATPAWGHIGQVSGCQNNFEVGDPLTGTAFTVNYNGFTYHPQELAFFSWFYRTASSGTGGLYSFEGAFTSSQGSCA